jgi:phosphoadenosine phosphosulfate reductase
MTVEEITDKIKLYKQLGLKLFTTSSFQTHSTVLLHIISKADNTIPVYFIHTGYHFPETLIYRDEIAKLFDLNVINVYSATSKINQRDANGRLLFASDPDLCCHLNKVVPLEPILAQYDVWINGVRADQGELRKSFKVEEKAKLGTIRFHPMLDWTAKMIYDYLRENNIPHHPLENKGYFSIGCEPCTRKWDLNMDERNGRWYGLKKTECGLNTELVVK